MLTKAYIEEVLLNQRLSSDVQKIKSFEETLLNSLSINEQTYYRKSSNWLDVKVTEVSEHEIKLQDEKTKELFAIVI